MFNKLNVLIVVMANILLLIIRQCSADDIRDSMYEPNTTTGLMGRWKLDERESDGTYPDTSSNGNHAR